MPSPILFWSTSATRRRITPSASSRWMRFQHGVDDSPTRSADLGDRQGGVLLQHGQDLAVDGVEAAVGFRELNG